MMRNTSSFVVPDDNVRTKSRIPISYTHTACMFSMVPRITLQVITDLEWKKRSCLPTVEVHTPQRQNGPIPQLEVNTL